jgi:hypothetical protein
MWQATRKSCFVVKLLTRIVHDFIMESLFSVEGDVVKIQDNVLIDRY